MSDRTTNVKRNIVFGFLQVLISMFLPFVVRTIILYRYGVDYLGLSSLFASVLTVLSLMELGFGVAIVYCMYKPVAEKDNEQICAYLSYFRKVYLVVGVLVLTVGLLLMPVLPSLVRDATMPGRLDLYFCYLIFLGNTVLSYILFGYISVIPQAHQRRDILSRIDLFGSVFQCALSSLVLLLSRSFYLYLFSLPVSTIVHNLLLAYVVRKKYPHISCRGVLSEEKKKDLKKRVYGILINKLTGVSRNSIDSMCISAFIGLAITGMYNNYYFVLAAVTSFSGMFCKSMMPGVGNSIALETPSKNYADMRKFDFIYMSFGAWAVVCMLCLFQPFMKTWVGDEMMFGLPVVLCVCAYFYILLCGDIRWVYHEGAGLWWECRYIMIGEAAANIILNIVLCKVMGITGIILATVITVFVTNLILCPEVLFREYFKNGKAGEYRMDHLLYALTMLLTAGLSFFSCRLFLPLSMVDRDRIWLCLLVMGGRLLICSSISVMVAWLLWHKTERYQKAVTWVRAMLRPGKK